jgi:ABC-type glycerol-3-phosphate transport system permease component
VVTIVLVVALVLTDALLALAAGALARVRGRRFWFWALLGLLIPVVTLAAVLILPRPGRT